MVRRTSLSIWRRGRVLKRGKRFSTSVISFANSAISFSSSAVIVIVIAAASSMCATTCPSSFEAACLPEIPVIFRLFVLFHIGLQSVI
ncbi:hypothetical protein GGE07_006471 [Sinorhizobium terangae]|uniref:hypothetical protein n=1 Tax=Sinorhizobium terangae TaxID=110322 RepID=UPI00160BA7DE|nr:hypothetical protein [Sinorhizobium terangae]MBB4189773.1 hypothetical protein [Sinorhizobium terangae]